MAIDATVAGPNANSYSTIAEFDALALQRLGVSAWSDTLEVERALLQSTQILEQIDYVGDAFTTTQALKWPRWHEDTQELIRNYPTDAIPQPIKRAQFEIALWLLASGGSVTSSDATVDSLKIGNSVEIKYAQSSSSAVVDTSVDAWGLPIQAARFLRGLREVPVLA